MNTKLALSASLVSLYALLAFTPGCASTSDKPVASTSASALDQADESLDATIRAEAWTTVFPSFRIRYPEVLRTSCGAGADITLGIQFGEVTPDHVQILGVSLASHLDPGDALSVGVIDIFSGHHDYAYDKWFGWTLHGEAAAGFEMNEVWWELSETDGVDIRVPLTGALTATPDLTDGLEAPKDDTVAGLACARPILVRIRPAVAN